MLARPRRCAGRCSSRWQGGGGLANSLDPELRAEALAAAGVVELPARAKMHQEAAVMHQEAAAAAVGSQMHHEQGARAGTSDAK